MIFPRLWFCALFVAITAEEPTIDLPQGEFKGVRKPTHQRSTVVAFLGIPYAQQPTGKLRFQLPQEVEPSNRTFQASQFGAACPQPDMDRLRASEDCLNLNVWIPEMPVEGKTYPVLVFLDGEMFTTGNAGNYPAEDLAAEGVIVVSVNYRLNIFGFLSLESEEAPGNLGLWDQHMALQWVQQNIARFGGDPRRVTLMGHGAGAASASMHMVSAKSKGLFDKAILMSGSAYAPWAVSHRAREAALNIARFLGCRIEGQDSEILDCLRSRDVRDIVQAFVRHQKDMNTTEIFAPVVQNFLSEEAAFLHENPVILLQKGDFPKIRVIAGVAENEGTAVLGIVRNLGRKNYEELAHLFLTASIPTVINQYGFYEAKSEIFLGIRYNYYDKAEVGDKATLLSRLLDFYSDAYFVAPHDYLVTALIRNGIPTYVYRYDYMTTDPLTSNLNGTSAIHGSELLYLFGPTVYRQELGVGFSRQDEAVSDLLKRLWFEFIQGGDPTPSSFGIKWEASNRDGLRNYGIKDQLSKEPYPYHRVKFWTEYLPALERVARGEIDALNPINRPPYEGRFRFDPTQPYQSIMWVLIAAISVLLIAFILSMASMRRQRSFA